MNTASFPTPGFAVRRSRSGWFFGVCGGLAKHFNLDPAPIRLIVVIGFILSGFFPVGLAYLVAAAVMKVEPEAAPRVPHPAVSSRRLDSFRRLERVLDELDRRTRRLEDEVVRREVALK